MPLILLVRRFRFPVLVGVTALMLLVPAARPAAQGALVDPPTRVTAQQAVDQADVPAHIAILDGHATVERDRRIEDALENDAVLAGDRLRTERASRLEILFADNSTIDVDEFSSVDLQSDGLMRLLAGQVRLSFVRGRNDVDYRVDSAPASVVIRTPGDYRVALSETRGGAQEIQLAVLHGAAELQNALGRTMVRAGMQASATARSQPSPASAFNTAEWDTFDRWVEETRSARYSVTSSHYLPEELTYYSSDFDHAGNWGYEPAYGYVWYPHVEAYWRPYYSGSWSFVAPFGWYWVGAGRWVWPTHHYGRWGLNGSRWYWIPGRSWAGAWVGWATAPGYVGWCPLGFNGFPVVGVTNFAVRPAWTVLPARTFTSHVVVTNHVVDPRDLAPAVRGSFVSGRGVPLTVGATGTAPPLRAPAARPTVSGTMGRDSGVTAGDSRGVAVMRGSAANVSTLRSPSSSTSPADAGSPWRRYRAGGSDIGPAGAPDANRWNDSSPSRSYAAPRTPGAPAGSLPVTRYGSRAGSSPALTMPAPLGGARPGDSLAPRPDAGSGGSAVGAGRPDPWYARPGPGQRGGSGASERGGAQPAPPGRPGPPPGGLGPPPMAGGGRGRG